MVIGFFYGIRVSMGRILKIFFMISFRYIVDFIKFLLLYVSFIDSGDILYDL